MMNFQIGILRLFAFLAVISLGSALLADAHAPTSQNACAVPDYRTDERPDSKGPPTEVTVGIRLMDVTEINDVDQTISVDLALKTQWVDPRLEGLGGCRISAQDIWFPSLLLNNSGRMFVRWPQVVSVEEGGKATFFQRISGTFASYVTLSDFPFDKQDIELNFFAMEWSSEKLIIKNDDVFSGVTPRLNISDWSITGVKTQASDLEIQALQQTHSAYTMTVSAERYLSYYIWKIFFPIAMIVVMSWCVFWIEPSQFGTKVGLSATSVLTMIAFIFATTNLLPKLGYFTTLDRYIAGATFLVFAALLQSLSSGFLVAQKREHVAVTVDRFSRILFPAIFAAFCILIMAHNF